MRLDIHQRHFRKADQYVTWKLRRWLRAKHQCRRWVLEDATGLLAEGWPVLGTGPDCAYELNAAGRRLPKSRMREPHVRSDEGVLETGAVERIDETPAQGESRRATEILVPVAPAPAAYSAAAEGGGPTTTNTLRTVTPLLQRRAGGLRLTTRTRPPGAAGRIPGRAPRRAAPTGSSASANPAERSR